MAFTFTSALLNYGIVNPPDPFTGLRLSTFVLSHSDMHTSLATVLFLLGCISALVHIIDLFKVFLSFALRLVFGISKSRSRPVSQLFLVKLMGSLLLLPLLVSSIYTIWLSAAHASTEAARIEHIIVQLVKFVAYGRDVVYPYGGTVHRFDPVESRIKGLMYALYADVECLASRDVCMIGDERNIGRLTKFILSNDSETIFERLESLGSFIVKTVTEQYMNATTLWMLVRYVSALGRSVIADMSSLFEQATSMAVLNGPVAFRLDTVATRASTVLDYTSSAMHFINFSLIPYLVQCAHVAHPHLIAAINFIIGTISAASVYGITTTQSMLPAVRGVMLYPASVNPIIQATRGLWNDVLKSLFMVAGMLMTIAFRHYRRGTLKHMISLLEPENVDIIKHMFQKCDELSDERDALLRERNKLVNKRRAFSQKHNELFDERNALFDKCSQLQCLLDEARSSHCKAAFANANMTSKIQNVARKLVRASEEMVDQAKENEAQIILLNHEIEEVSCQRKKMTLLYKIAHSKVVSIGRKFKVQRKLLLAKRKTIRSLQLAVRSSRYEAETSVIQATNLDVDNKLIKDAFGLLYSGAFSYMPGDELFKIESLIMASIELYSSDDVYGPSDHLSTSPFDSSISVNASTEDDTLADASCQLTSVGAAATFRIDMLSPNPRAPTSLLLQPHPKILDSPLPLLKGMPVPWQPSMVPETPTPPMLSGYVLHGASASTPVHVFKGPIKSRVTDSTRKMLAKSRAQENKENFPLCSV